MSKIRHSLINVDSAERSATDEQSQQFTDVAAAAPESGADTSPVPAPTAAPTKAQRENEPAFNPPHDQPATPRDRYHGKGGMYAIVDGKRVPIDEDGNPLPEEHEKQKGA